MIRLLKWLLTGDRHRWEWQKSYTAESNGKPVEVTTTSYCGCCGGVRVTTWRR